MIINKRVFIHILFIVFMGYAFSQSTPEFQIIKMADDLVFPEGPVWHPDGYLLFSDVHDSKILKLKPDGGMEIWFDQGIKTNGLILSHDKKKIIACGNSLKSLLEIDLKTRHYNILTNQYQGNPFNDVNDVAIDKEGNIFFTDPSWTRSTKNPQGIYCYTRKKNTILAAVLDKQPNGILISPDQKYLYVGRSGGSDVWRYILHPDGTLSDGTIFAQLEPGCQPDGMTLDSQGNFYIAQATNGKICILSQDGKKQHWISTPENFATNCEFDGKDKTILYVTCAGPQTQRKGTLYKIIFSEK